MAFLEPDSKVFVIFLKTWNKNKIVWIQRHCVFMPIMWYAKARTTKAIPLSPVSMILILGGRKRKSKIIDCQSYSLTTCSILNNLNLLHTSLALEKVYLPLHLWFWGNCFLTTLLHFGVINLLLFPDSILLHEFTYKMKKKRYSSNFSLSFFYSVKAVKLGTYCT